MPIKITGNLLNKCLIKYVNPIISNIHCDFYNIKIKFTSNYINKF